MENKTVIDIAASEISVVIPSYNRAALLRATIPSYFQTGVGEVIVVNDASGDDTAAVLQAMQNEFPGLKSVQLPKRSGQAAAKNVGKQMARYPLVYFGDDDSVLASGSMRRLLHTMQAMEADLVGARALYARDAKEFESMRLEQAWGETGHCVEEWDILSFHFEKYFANPQASLSTAACFLVKAAWLRQFEFNEQYRWNGYREETDFVLQLSLAGAKVVFDSAARQINLPRSIAGGGAHACGFWLWHYACVVNNWQFLNRFYPELKRRGLVSRPKVAIHLVFLLRGLLKTLRKGVAAIF